MAPWQPLNMASFSIVNFITNADLLHNEISFTLPPSEMHHDSATELVLRARNILKHESGTNYSANGFFYTGVSAPSMRVFTDHRCNWAALMLMSKEGAFKDRWSEHRTIPFYEQHADHACRKLAKALAEQDPINMSYVKDLQMKYGSFGAQSPVALDENGYQPGNESTLELECVVNDDAADTMFLENFMRHIALGAAVERGEKGEREIKRLRGRMEQIFRLGREQTGRIEELEQERDGLEAESDSLQQELAQWSDENDELRHENAQLVLEKEVTEYDNAQMAIDNARLQAKVAELEQRKNERSNHSFATLDRRNTNPTTRSRGRKLGNTQNKTKRLGRGLRQRKALRRGQIRDKDLGLDLRMRMLCIATKERLKKKHEKARYAEETS